MKVDTNKLKSKVCYICFDCGNNFDKRKNRQDHACTSHNGKCDVCGLIKGITHVRHFGYPIVEIKNG